MEEVIEIIKDRIKSIEEYQHIDTFKARTMILNDILRDVEKIKRKK